MDAPVIACDRNEEDGASALALPRPAEPDEEARHQLHRLIRAVDREIAVTSLSLRRNLAQLDALNQYFTGLLDSVDTGVVALDAEGRVVAMNRAAAALLAVDPAQACGAAYHTICLALTPAPPIAEALARNEAPSPVRRTLTQPDGSRLLVESSVSLIRDGNGRAIGAVHVLKDLSPMVEMERKLDRAARLASIGKVSATLAHEIRNPLSAIEGFSYLLMQDLAAGDPRRRFAENIVSAVRALNQALTSTLIFARDPQLTLAMIAPRELLETTAEFIRQETAAKGMGDIRVRVEADAALGEDAAILGDSEQLKRALLNLAKNAVEAMPDGGDLTLRATWPPTDSQRSMVRLSVRDTGRGIAPEIRGCLFEPFETTKEHGTGLGLAIVKKVVELHGGRASFESAAAGAVFHLDLPSAVAVDGSESDPT